MLGSYNLIPGLIAIILFQTTISSTALSIVKERERGTIEQLSVPPIRGWELVLAKIIPYILVSFVDTILILLLGTFWFGPAAALSGGMQKKLGLAAALVHKPKVLLLDEPSGGVDPVARQEFWHLLISLLCRGWAVLVSTSYMDEAMRFNRVIFMNHGRALIQAPPRAVDGQFNLFKRLNRGWKMFLRYWRIAERRESDCCARTSVL